MHGDAVVLRVNHVAVQDDEGLGIGIDGRHATDGLVGTDAGHAVAQDGANIAGEQTLDILVDRNAAALVDVCRLLRNDGCAIGEVTVEVGSNQVGISHAVLDCHLQGIVPFGIDIDSIREHGDGELVRTVLVGQDRIPLQAQGLDADTAHGLACSIVDNHAANLLHLVRLLRFGSLLDDNRLLFFDVFLLCIDVRHAKARKSRKA